LTSDLGSWGGGAGELFADGVDGADQGGGGVAAAELGGHDGGDLLPEGASHLLVDAGVAEHGEVAPPGSEISKGTSIRAICF
jgi:hypothetical protein